MDDPVLGPVFCEKKKMHVFFNRLFTPPIGDRCGTSRSIVLLLEVFDYQYLLSFVPGEVRDGMIP